MKVFYYGVGEGRGECVVLFNGNEKNKLMDKRYDWEVIVGGVGGERFKYNESL